jgi:hypothetical protein
MPIEEPISREIYKKVLLRVLENLKRAIYEINASNGIARGNPSYTSPQIFPLARDALHLQAILHAAKAFDHHPRAASFFALFRTAPDFLEAVAAAQNFELKRLDDFADKLRKIRNRALAHDDLDDIRRDRDVWNEQDLSVGEFLSCAAFAFEASNTILENEFGERFDMLGYDGGDAEELARTANALGLPRKWSDRLL